MPRLRGGRGLRALWPLRTSLVCFLTSVPHLFLSRTGYVYNQLFGIGLLFAAIFAAFVSGATLGGTLRNGFLACRGTVLSCLVVTAVVAVAGTSPTAVYVALVVGSVVIVTPVLQPVSTRMAWAIYTAGLALALEQRGEYQLTIALRLAFVSVVGIVVAVLCTLPPWPCSRASDACASSLRAAGRDVGAAVDTLTYVLHPSGKACHSAVRAHASRLLASSATHTDAGAGLLLEVAWECGPAAALGRHVSLLRQCDVFARGMSMAVDAQRKEDAHQAELLTHVHRAMSSVVGGGAPASNASGDGDVGSRVRSLTDEQVAVLQSYSEQAETMDTMLADVCACLARCVGAVLDDLLEDNGDSLWRRWRPRAVQTQGDDCADGRAQRREALRQALIAFDRAVTDVRKALFYAPVEGAQRAEAQARIEVSLAVLGPRTGRYLLLFCLRAMATHVLTAASPPVVPSGGAPPAPAPATEARSPRRWGRAARRVLASYGLPPDVPRMIYVLKLTGAVTAALAAGTAIDGSGVWSALSVAFIAPRDHADKHAGGSFRTAALRLSGTIVGSIWGFMAYSVAASAHSVSPLQRQLVALVLLAVGVFVFGLARFSPRHAYGAIVAQFTPYVMGDIPPGVPLQQWAIKRIQLNIVGVLIFVFIELFIFPRRAPVALRGELSASLVAARSAVATVWEVQLGAGGVAACPSCCLASAADVAAQEAALTAGVQRMRALLTEIGDEADWAPLSVSPVPVPPLRPCMALVDDFSALAVLLGLMHGVLANAGGDAAGVDDITHGAALGRLVSPCAPALRALLSRVWEHYSALEEDLAVAVSPKQRLGVGMAPQSPRGGSRPGAQHARAVALARMETALAGFEARTSAVFVSMLRSHRTDAAPVVPSTVMVPFLALCLCTRFLVHNAQHMARHASEMLDMPYSLPPRLDVNGGGGETRGENGGDDGHRVSVPLLDPSEDEAIHIPAAGPGGVVEDGDSSTCPVCHRARVRPSQRLDQGGELDDADIAALVADDDVEARPRGWDSRTPT